ncbi:MAG: hypothetical protein AAB875_05480 [Patescibacteria group bacterium]
MKIIVLHGDNTAASYERLNKFIEAAKERGWEINFIEGSENLQERLTKVSLFANETFYVLRGFTRINKSSLKKLQNRLKNIPGNLVIYHEDFIPKEILGFLPQDAKIEEYKLPRLIFDFLDSFYPGNAKKAIVLLHELWKNEPPEFVFALLARQVRDLYWAKSGGSMPYPSWRVQKLKNQAAKFSQEALEDIIKSLSETDIKVKTSQAELTSSLDLLAITLLK